MDAYPGIWPPFGWWGGAGAGPGGWANPCCSRWLLVALTWAAAAAAAAAALKCGLYSAELYNAAATSFCWWLEVNEACKFSWKDAMDYQVQQINQNLLHRLDTIETSLIICVC